LGGEKGTNCAPPQKKGDGWDVPFVEKRRGVEERKDPHHFEKKELESRRKHRYGSSEVRAGENGGSARGIEGRSWDGVHSLTQKKKGERRKGSQRSKRRRDGPVKLITGGGGGALGV